MLRVRGWVWVGACGWLLFGPACADRPERNQIPPEEAFCEAWCTAYWQCEGVPRSDCLPWCYLDDTGFFERVNPQALALAARCLPTRSCWEVTQGQFVGLCLEAVEPQVEPTESLIAFCESISPTWFDCGYYADVGWCVDEFRSWSDAVLDAASQCAPLACEEVEQCLDRVFG